MGGTCGESAVVVMPGRAGLRWLPDRRSGLRRLPDRRSKTVLAPNAQLRSLASAEAQAATADVPNFASGGVTIFVAYD